MMLLSALALASTLAAPTDDWSRVVHLKRGAEVIVSLQPGAPSRPDTGVARVVSVTDSELVVAPLRIRPAVVRIERSDVATVMLRRERTRGSAQERTKGVLLGLLFGLIGAANGGTGPTLCDKSAPGCIAYIGAGAVAGGMIGYFGGKSETILDLTVVYRAPPRV
jgi:hypothetical protein